MEKKRDFALGVTRIVVWLCIWELLNLAVGSKIPFAGSVDTAIVLWENLFEREFYQAVWTTFSGISVGFFVAMVIGTVLGYLSFFNKHLDFFLTPVMDFFRYIPMITFTLLAIMWTSSSALAFEVGMFLSLPVIYKNTLIGLRNTNQHYLQRVMEIKMKPLKKLIYLHQPVAMPEYITGCHRALNMCWKSGIIAQMLGHTKHSIGSKLYEASDAKDVAAIFAWTLVIVLLSIAFEQIVIRILSIDKFNAGRVDIQAVFENLEDEEIDL